MNLFKTDKFNSFMVLYCAQNLHFIFIDTTQQQQLLLSLISWWYLPLFVCRQKLSQHSWPNRSSSRWRLQLVSRKTSLRCSWSVVGSLWLGKRVQSEDPEISGLAGEICSKITSVPKVLGIMIPISLLFDGCGMCELQWYSMCTKK